MMTNNQWPITIRRWKTPNVWKCNIFYIDSASIL